MTERDPIEITNLAPERSANIEWSWLRDVLAAPPPPDTPGGHLSSYLATVRPNGQPHATGVGARWYDGDLYFLSGPSTRKSQNLAANPACSIGMRVEELDLVFEGEAAPISDPQTLAAVGDLIRQSGWPVRLTDGGFTASFGPPDCPPPWQLYRFTFCKAIGQGDRGATRWRFG